MCVDGLSACSQPRHIHETLDLFNLTKTNNHETFFR